MRNLMVTSLALAALIVAAPLIADDDSQMMKALGILNKNCAGCHQAADHPGALFLNRARLSEAKTQDLVLNLLKTSQMPPAHKNFKNTEDGKSLIAWLESEKAARGKK